jgi:hypothetical protein
VAFDYSLVLPSAKANTLLNAQLKATHSQGKSLQNLKLEKVKPWMTIHGHPTSTRDLQFAKSPTSDGVFEISGLFFIMAGPWDVEFVISGEDEANPSAQRVVTIPVEIGE